MRTGSVSKYIQDLLWEEAYWSGPSTEETVALTVPIRAAYTPAFGRFVTIGRPVFAGGNARDAELTPTCRGTFPQLLSRWILMF